VPITLEKLKYARQGDPVLVRDAGSGKRWMIIVRQVPPVYVQDQIKGEVFFELASPERYARNGECECRVSREDILVWRFLKNRMEFPG
jgi:hypothetical protein